MKKYLLFIFITFSLFGQKILIPMDAVQTDHLKAYGIVHGIIKKGIMVEWLLNYRGGSFLMDSHDFISREGMLKGVTMESVNTGNLSQIYISIESNNMDIIKLEKSAKIAVYSPPDKQPWDDAVTLALTYAEIDYDVIFDDEIFLGSLNKYDWLHLHHEDFTGQYGKFYKNYNRANWYVQQKADFEKRALKYGFSSVSEMKKAVARTIKDYVLDGGFLFAMCSATDSYDIALAAENVDIVESVYDGSPVDPNYRQKLDYSKSFAFENFDLYTSPLTYEYSTIDFPSSHRPIAKGAEADYFTLFNFSAKWDPVPTMLTQNHVNVVNGFMGQTTGFNRNTIKKHVVIMGDVPNDDMVKYIHGRVGKGTFTFFGGHDPEDYRHFVGDPVTDLSLHRNSPGYRLILNNVLFPAARKKERKT
ncbi:MAG: asparagine synthetase B [Candidatus Marinimicrobia bacterium]|nr:asparagine synthetase B [Candidatus Neomarinimicrobiota bacterium]